MLGLILNEAFVTFTRQRLGTLCDMCCVERQALPKHAPAFVPSVAQRLVQGQVVLDDTTRHESLP